MTRYVDGNGGWVSMQTCPLCGHDGPHRPIGPTGDQFECAGCGATLTDVVPVGEED